MLFSPDFFLLFPRQPFHSSVSLLWEMKCFSRHDCLLFGCVVMYYQDYSMVDKHDHRWVTAGRLAMGRIHRLLIGCSVLTALTLFAGCGPDIPGGTTGSPTPAGRSGPVTLHTNASAYQPGDAFLVTLRN